MGESLPPAPPLITHEIEFDTLHPRFSRVRDYLESKTGGTRLASRADIDPVELPDVLAFVNLIDVAWSGPDQPSFTFRLLGTRQIRYAGGDFTGKLVEDALSGASANTAVAAMRRVATERRPIFGRFAMPIDGREFVTTERLMFPLSPDNGVVNMLLSIHNYPE
jgi:hypothetical protein